MAGEAGGGGGSRGGGSRGVTERLDQLMPRAEAARPNEGRARPRDPARPSPDQTPDPALPPHSVVFCASWCPDPGAKNPPGPDYVGPPRSYFVHLSVSGDKTPGPDYDFLRTRILCIVGFPSSPRLLRLTCIVYLIAPVRLEQT